MIKTLEALQGGMKESILNQESVTPSQWPISRGVGLECAAASTCVEKSALEERQA